MIYKHTILKYPLTTEKNVRLMQKENKLVFIVERQSNKQDIKEAVEQLFKVKVKYVNTQIIPSGKKKAYITLAQETPALDVATQLGVI